MKQNVDRFGRAPAGSATLDGMLRLGHRLAACSAAEQQAAAASSSGFAGGSGTDDSGVGTSFQPHPVGGAAHRRRRRLLPIAEEGEGLAGARRPAGVVLQHSAQSKMHGSLSAAAAALPHDAAAAAAAGQSSDGAVAPLPALPSPAGEDAAHEPAGPETAPAHAPAEAPPAEAPLVEAAPAEALTAEAAPAEEPAGAATAPACDAASPAAALAAAVAEADELDAPCPTAGDSGRAAPVAAAGPVAEGARLTLCRGHDGAVADPASQATGHGTEALEVEVRQPRSSAACRVQHAAWRRVQFLLLTDSILTDRWTPALAAAARWRGGTRHLLHVLHPASRPYSGNHDSRRCRMHVSYCTHSMYPPDTPHMYAAPAPSPFAGPQVFLWQHPLAWWQPQLVLLLLPHPAPQPQQRSRAAAQAAGPVRGALAAVLRHRQCAARGGVQSGHQQVRATEVEM